MSHRTAWAQTEQRHRKHQRVGEYKGWAIIDCVHYYLIGPPNNPDTEQTPYCTMEEVRKAINLRTRTKEEMLRHIAVRGLKQIFICALKEILFGDESLHVLNGVCVWSLLTVSEEEVRQAYLQTMGVKPHPG